MTTDVTKATTRPSWAAELSDRHWIFVESYVSELSGVEAALAAGLGHDRKSAREQACRLRKRQDIQDTISRLLAERVGAGKARVIDEISSIAFAEPSEAISVAEKLNALALLSKVLGLQVHKTEVSGPGGQPMALTLEASSARARIESRLGEIARRKAAALPAPAEPPIPMERMGDVYSAVPARPYPTAGERE